MEQYCTASPARVYHDFERGFLFENNFSKCLGKCDIKSDTYKAEECLKQKKII